MPSLMNTTIRSRFDFAIEATAACTVLKSPLPSAATVISGFGKLTAKLAGANKNTGAAMKPNSEAMIQRLIPILHVAFVILPLMMRRFGIIRLRLLDHGILQRARMQ